ncbi:patatin-like phospholipase family protein [Mesorhizobium sp. M0915]|uniref:hypothetical protein n=1 Tax=Mesorhizobium sp. M0915 TaxID=2957027 RepID=UPI0033397DAF
MVECDLVMKGGVTSGVVYPHAIVEVARKYRLRNIGGTSAGAIAAVIAAAAEYRRQSSAAGSDFAGFDATAKIADELGTDMLGLFQPSPDLTKLFSIAMSAMGASKKGRVWNVLCTMLCAYPWHVVLALGVGLVLVILGVRQGSPALVVLGALVAIALVIAALAFALGMAILVALPRHDFGICSGLTQPHLFKKKRVQQSALTEWLADKIDLVAGRDPKGDPLTVGQLEAFGINVAAVTTDLSSHRPFQLPLKSRHHYFSKAEFEKLFPLRIIAYLTRDAVPLADATPADLYPLPVGTAFPVVLVARMSLSFPGLIRAVPLYRFDDQLPGDAGDRAKVRRCLFSDGGISSNFPIHFFDAFLPSRPTFGIMLVDWDEARHDKIRVFLPQKWRQSTDLPVMRIGSLGAFLGSVLRTAREWQDTLQSLLPGYAERIVEVRLDPSREGGLNLSMDRKTIATLTEYGRQAGTTLTTQFDFDEHRWRRALSLLPELEDSMRAFANSHSSRPAGSAVGTRTYAEVLTGHDAISYKNSQKWRDEVLAPFATAVAKIGTDAQAQLDADKETTVASGTVPAVDSHLRLVADTDRAPRRPAES